MTRQFQKIDPGTRWRLYNNCIVSCLANGDITINAKIIAELAMKEDAIQANPEAMHLILAAPELLEALIKARNHIATTFGFPQFGHAARARVDELDAVILKACGGKKPTRDEVLSEDEKNHSGFAENPKGCS